MRKFAVDRLIDTILTMYILSLFMFTFREGLYLISNGLAFLFIFLVFTKHLATRSKIVINVLLLYQLLFILVSVISVFYATNSKYAINNIRTLSLILFLTVAITNYVDSISKVNRVINSFILAGVLSGIYIILTSDFDLMVRFGSQLGDLNDVGRMFVVSAVFTLHKYKVTKKRRYLICLLWIVCMILLTGSRQSLLFLGSTIVILTYLGEKNELKGLIRNIITGILLLGSLYFALTKIEIFYQVIGKRLEAFIAMFTHSGKVDNSSLTRQYMIRFGFQLFKERPLLGHGANNYRFLYGLIHGIDRYAHNNMIELLVNVGLMGTFFHYITNVAVIKNMRRLSRNRKIIQLEPFIAILLSYIFVGIAAVYYYDKHYNFLIAIALSLLAMQEKVCVENQEIKFNNMETRVIVIPKKPIQKWQKQ